MCRWRRYRREGLHMSSWALMCLYCLFVGFFCINCCICAIILLMYCSYHLKTGNAFYARALSDFTSWLVCGLAAREKRVKGASHIREAIWNSLRRVDSYAELHYYSNYYRLMRFEDGQHMYVKFKVRPCNISINEDRSQVVSTGVLQNRDKCNSIDVNDSRLLLFLSN